MYYFYLYRQQSTGSNTMQGDDASTSRIDADGNPRGSSQSELANTRTTSSDMSEQGEALRCALETMEQRLPTVDNTDPAVMLRTMHMMHLASYGSMHIKSEGETVRTTADDTRARESNPGSAVPPISEEEVSLGGVSTGAGDRSLPGDVHHPAGIQPPLRQVRRHLMPMRISWV